MKKFILSFLVIVVFAVYSLLLQHHNLPAFSVSIPASPTNNNPTTPSTATSQTATPSPAPATASTYKDGNYTGSAADAIYGYIQVKAIIQGGKLTDVQFLQYPNDRRNSVEINQQAMPYLQQEAIKAQSAHVNGVSGATDTSQAFIQSLSSALSQAV